MAEVKLLTKAEWRARIDASDHFKELAIAALDNAGLIAQEPVDALREIVEDLWHISVGPKGEAVTKMTAELRRRGVTLAPAASPWKEIATAPKDGTFILAIQNGRHPDGHFYVPAVVQWKRGTWQTLDDDCPDEGWPLSHWMPLPANPALTEGQSK